VTLAHGYTSARLTSLIAGTRKSLDPWTGSRAVTVLDEQLQARAVTT
jgi:hypothetical protein